jgi:hypothetical protein
LLAALLTGLEEVAFRRPYKNANQLRISIYKNPVALKKTKPTLFISLKANQLP